MPYRAMVKQRKPRIAYSNLPCFIVQYRGHHCKSLGLGLLCTTNNGRDEEHTDEHLVGYYFTIGRHRYRIIIVLHRKGPIISLH